MSGRFEFKDWHDLLGQVVRNSFFKPKYFFTVNISIKRCLHLSINCFPNLINALPSNVTRKVQYLVICVLEPSSDRMKNVFHSKIQKYKNDIQ